MKQIYNLTLISASKFTNMIHKPKHPYAPNKPLDRYYALVVDDSTQWFSYLICFDSGLYKPVIESYELPNIDNLCQILQDVWSRPTSFSNMRFNLGSFPQTFNGVYISEREFQKIRMLIELWPAVQEFNKLSQS